MLQDFWILTFLISSFGILHTLWYSFEGVRKQKCEAISMRTPVVYDVIRYRPFLNTL